MSEIFNKPRRLRNDFAASLPDAIDILIICLESGQSLSKSIHITSIHFNEISETVSDEFERITLETLAGKDRAESLYDLGQRHGNSDVSAFVAILKQSHIIGTPSAGSLRLLSSELRERKMMEAEERANKMAIKMTLATMLLTVPPILIMLVGPSLYEVVQLINSTH